MTKPILATPQWQRDLAAAVRDPMELVRLLDLPVETVSLSAAQDFRLLVPLSYLKRIVKGDWSDPLLRQVLPLDAELQVVEGFNYDPVGDQYAQVANGVLHKYQGRVLVVTTGACAIHCRYCFRRHFPYTAANPLKQEWEGLLHYLRTNPDVQEVILSGGDPLTLADERLSHLLQGLKNIPSIKRLRLHTRLPVVLPSRINTAFLDLLSTWPQQVVMVLHINHAQELNAADVQQALSGLRSSGVTLLNQAVLLRGVNDSLHAQVALSEAGFAQGILPYYLHILDRVAGAAHFEVSESQAIALMRALREKLPGFLVPRLVREVAGVKSKVPIL